MIKIHLITTSMGRTNSIESFLSLATETQRQLVLSFLVAILKLSILLSFKILQQ